MDSNPPSIIEFVKIQYGNYTMNEATSARIA